MGSGPGLIRRVAWPSAEWGSIPIEGGVSAAFRRQIESAADPLAERSAIEQRLLGLRSPLRGAERFAVEDLIDPRDTRLRIFEFLEASKGARLLGLGPKSFAGVLP